VFGYIFHLSNLACHTLNEFDHQLHLHFVNGISFRPNADLMLYINVLVYTASFVETGVHQLDARLALRQEKLLSRNILLTPNN
jgi:hypothetical protein